MKCLCRRQLTCLWWSLRKWNMGRIFSLRKEWRNLLKHLNGSSEIWLSYSWWHRGIPSKQGWMFSQMQTALYAGLSTVCPNIDPRPWCEWGHGLLLKWQLLIWTHWGLRWKIQFNHNRYEACLGKAWREAAGKNLHQGQIEQSLRTYCMKELHTVISGNPHYSSEERTILPLF